MTISISEPPKELVDIKLLIFKQYQVDVKNIKCCFQCWQKQKNHVSYNYIPYSSNLGDY
jgi:hypothetical protein